MAVDVSQRKSQYKIAVGWTSNPASLTLFNPQPRSLGVRYTRRSYFVGTNPFLDEGRYIELLWSALEDDLAYRQMLQQFGLHNTYAQQVSLWARDEIWSYHLYNGWAHRPLLGNDANWEFMPKDITVLVRDLVLIS